MEARPSRGGDSQEKKGEKKMSLLSDLPKLAELEKQASPAPWKRWTKSDCEGAIHHRIDTSDPDSDPIKVDFEEDWKLIAELRNAAPAMFAVLAKFRPGYKKELESLEEELRALEDNFCRDYTKLYSMLHELQAACQLMEAERESPTRSLKGEGL